jgi:hypothetical protein
MDVYFGVYMRVVIPVKLRGCILNFGVYMRVVIPVKLRGCILNELHVGHIGVD